VAVESIFDDELKKLLAAPAAFKCGAGDYLSDVRPERRGVRS
jgi:hypothetical protein